MSNQRNLEQERASVAWEYVTKEVKKLPEKVQKEYASLAKKAPADIQSNGLGQTMAFWRAKGYENGREKDNKENAHYQLSEHVRKWLGNTKSLGLQTDNFVAWVIAQEDVKLYRRATAETIAFLIWLKRFAESELPE